LLSSLPLQDLISETAQTGSTVEPFLVGWTFTYQMPCSHICMCYSYRPLEIWLLLKSAVFYNQNIYCSFILPVWKCRAVANVQCCADVVKWTVLVFVPFSLTLLTLRKAPKSRAC